MSTERPEKDPYRYFRVEVRELLEGLGQGALRLEKNGGGDAVALLLRLAHTLKGAARVVRRDGIAELAHAVEDLLAPYRSGEARVPQDRVDEMLRLLDAMSGEVAALGPGVEPASNGADRPAASKAPSAEELFDRTRVELGDMDALLDQISETTVQLTRFVGDAAPLARARQLIGLLAEEPTRRDVPADRVAATRTRAYLEELREQLDRVERNLSRGAEQVGRSLAQVGETANRLRLVPVSAIFPVLERAVRDAGQALGRTVEFTASGGEARVHPDVLGAVRTALLHAVRNAVAHGIEPETERRAAGKPDCGRVTLGIARRGTRLVFVCRDDGRGIDESAVRRAAMRSGMSAAEAGALAPAEVTALLLRGGMTTAGTVTAVSGRGVGLDVVRETAAQLKAEVRLTSQPGHGTTLELVVPVSLASLAALLVDAGGTTAAVPLEAVRGAIRVGAEDVIRAGGGESVLHDGKAIPFISLATALGRDRGPSDGGRTGSAVVVAAGEELVAVGVVRLLGTADIVVRALPRAVQVAAIVAGASVDALGEPQLVLDPDGLMAAARAERPGLETVQVETRPPVLVVDDSLTTRMLEQSILESAGYRVELAVSAEEAIDKARERRYGAFLVDVEMPGMDGFEFVARTRSDPALRETPAILVSSRNSPEDLERGARAGARGYIVKSEFDQSSFLEMVRELVG